ncbi:hypothetical protein MMC19_004017 [Ptychographa xylographoides]|nr:hypothetical protein [Ptychographa xylographoides]
MENPLLPLSKSGLNVMSTSNLALSLNNKLSKKTESRSFDFDPESENQYDEDPGETTQSSPFVADINTSLRSSSRQPSPGKQIAAQASSAGLEPIVSLKKGELKEIDDSHEAILVYEDGGADGYSDIGHDALPMTEAKGYDGTDDTCFSTFSAVPNTDMTQFASLGQSPGREVSSSPTRVARHRDGQRTPIHSRPTTPGTLRQYEHDTDLSCASPTPRNKFSSHVDDTTNLLEFTGQLSTFSQTLSQSPFRSTPKKHDFTGYPASHRLRSPTKDGFMPTSPTSARHLTNLLDFDLPPAPTPRSVPTVTARELESLKSSFLSQISSLKATLSGKEAEITSLKDAKDDAEQRVGKALEELRDFRDTKEDLMAEKGEWEKRDREMQNVLRQVKQEIIRNDKERDELLTRSRELERRYEEADIRASEAETKVAGLEAGSSALAQGNGNIKEESGVVSTPGSGSNKAVEMAVEKVARELHALYKAKHETKVGALKKSYEARWEKRIRELQYNVEELSKENDELRLGRDATMSGVVSASANSDSYPHSQPPSYSESDAAEREEEMQLLQDMKTQLDALSAEIEALRNDNDILSSNIDALRKDNDTCRTENSSLRTELSTSRHENSELVTAVEQMLLLESSSVSSSTSVHRSASVALPHSHAQPQLQHGISSMGVPGEAGFKNPLTSRASGLKGPGFGSVGGGSGLEGRFGMSGTGMKRTLSGPQGLGQRSGIMSNIERMGRGRGAE